MLRQTGLLCGNYNLHQRAEIPTSVVSIFSFYSVLNMQFWAGVYWRISMLKI